MNPAVDIEDMSAEWLTKALGYPVHSFTSQRVGTGQTAAAYRLELVADQGPKTMLAKVAGGDLDARKRVAGGFAREVGFYSKLAPTLDVRTPRCWHAAITEDCLHFTLLLEDLAPRQPGRQADGCSIERARGALRNLARLHTPRWNDPALLTLDFADQGFRSRKTAAWLGNMTQAACEDFVERYSAELPDADITTLRTASQAVEQWMVALDEPFAVLHGDYRMDNLMFGDEPDDVVALDWQTLAVGPPTRDLAYFIGTCLEVETRRKHEHELVQLYHQAVVDRGIRNYDFNRCYRDYRLGHLQATMITTIGAVYATGERTRQSDEMFLAMITRSCAAIRDLGTLELL